MTRRRRTTTADPAWSRNRLVGLLAAAITAVVLLAVGLVLAVYYTLNSAAPTPAAGRTRPAAAGATEPQSTGTAGAAAPGSVRSRKDALAAAPMITVDTAAAQPGVVSTRDPGVIVVPAPARTGPAGVPTGFPHTPQGALGQLAAIDQTAMQSASLAGVRIVIASWAAPGGPTPTSWSAVKAMADFLDAAGLSGGGSAQLSLVVTPLMGLIKGTVGTDFVLACVDFEFDATLTETGRVADADCQRMSWQRERWVIGPGPEPATPPSVWPDTDTAVAVGYRDLRHG